MNICSAIKRFFSGNRVAKEPPKELPVWIPAAFVVEVEVDYDRSPEEILKKLNREERVSINLAHVPRKYSSGKRKIFVTFFQLEKTLPYFEDGGRAEAVEKAYTDRGLVPDFYAQAAVHIVNGEFDKPRRCSSETQDHDTETQDHENHVFWVMDGQCYDCYFTWEGGSYITSILTVGYKMPERFIWIGREESCRIGRGTWFCGVAAEAE